MTTPTISYSAKTGSSLTANKAVNAGSYTVSITVGTDAGAKTATKDFEINKVNLTPTVTLSGWTYGGTANDPSVTGNTGNGAVTYTYKVKDADDSTYSSTKPTNAGSYTVKAAIAETTNYNAGSLF